ncbi:hypothetical protein [Saccharothrix texasensis]|uniref:Uncharacterized protein n=1 Tax=Saccharothrix texasensis TaxID=103734 RepID=A0A3N1H995_9PSEU|nr:hypothetical protein [Saccharothrix texasensis]ROP39105.1 hypothetical protein EDD40_4479 [Saccharothrix texasensis]
MRWSAKSKTAALTSGSVGKYTRAVELTGRCSCGDHLTGTATVTTVLGEMGTAVATTTHTCGANVQLTGSY